jgi:hypothetical protein
MTSTKQAIRLLRTEGVLKSNDTRFKSSRAVCNAVHCLKTYHGIEVVQSERVYPEESKSYYVVYKLAEA